MSKEVVGLPVKKLDLKLEYFDLNDWENKINDSCVAIQKEKNTVEEETVKVVFNQQFTVEVNKVKLLEKSEYFRAIMSSNFSEHKKGYADVIFEASTESFQQLMSYVNTGKININIEIVFEIYELANYLQISCLSKKCLNIFINNLNSKTVGHQLSKMKKNPFLYEDLKELAFKFKESGKPSYSGLYTLESPSFSRGSYSIQIINNQYEHCEYRHNFCGERYCGDYNQLKILQRFRNSMIISDKKWLYTRGHLSLFGLIQYCLISGKTNYLPLNDYSEYNENTIVCFDDDKTFFLLRTFIRKDINTKVSLSILGKKYDSEKIKIYKTKIFDLSSERKAEDFLETFIYFAVCDDETLFIFYTRCEKCKKPYSYHRYSSGSDVYILTISTKTLTVLSNRRLVECLQFDEKKSTKREDNFKIFEKIFHHNKTHKLFIKTEYCSINKQVMVIDLKSQSFYFIENFISASFDKRNSSDDLKIVTDDRNDTVYGLYTSLYSNAGELAAFRYNNENLIYTGMKLKLSQSRRSFCFV